MIVLNLNDFKKCFLNKIGIFANTPCRPFFPDERGLSFTKNVKGDDMEKEKQYDIANLSNEELQQVSTLEKTISREKGEEVVLIAYKEDK